MGRVEEPGVGGGAGLGVPENGLREAKSGGSVSPTVIEVERCHATPIDQKTEGLVEPSRATRTGQRCGYLSSNAKSQALLPS